jgi:nickel-dependent lactate racemase
MDKVTVNLAYGHGLHSLQVPLSRLLGTFTPRLVKQDFREENLIHEALAHPIGTPQLRDLAKKGGRVAIVTSDLTRPCPSHRLLPFILEELDAAGIPDEDILIILALGLHRPMTEQEIGLALSPAIQRRFRVLNHDITDTLRLGVTSAGTPVEIFRPVVEADLRVCLGNVDFHYFAGYSGGAKAIFPGCASKAGVSANHSMMIQPGAAADRVDGNPVRADLEEAAILVGVDFILNVVVDGEHQVVGAVAGDLIAAHRKGCEMVAARGKVRIPHRADIVVASAGGYPKDINLYQAQKALDNASYFVRDEGVIILAAECPEGFGNQTFKSWILDAASPGHVLERIRREFVLGGHKAAAIAAVQARAKVHMVSSMLPDEVRRSGIAHFDSLTQAFEAATAELGAASSVLVLPHAGSILPEVGGSGTVREK